MVVNIGLQGDTVGDAGQLHVVVVSEIPVICDSTYGFINAGQSLIVAPGVFEAVYLDAVDCQSPDALSIQAIDRASNSGRAIGNRAPGPAGIVTGPVKVANTANLAIVVACDGAIHAII